MKQKKPEQTNKEQLVLFPANYRIPAGIVKQGTEIQRPTFEDARCGPKPLDIKRFYKNKNKIKKINKKKTRGGKRHQIKKNVKQLRDILENCRSEEEKIRFSLLLNKAKNDLNRLNKKKKIN